MHASARHRKGVLHCYFLALACLASPSFSSVTVEVDVAVVTFVTSPQYLSVTIDSSSLIAGPKWNAWRVHMNDSAVTALTRALAPAYLRIGGTACDTIKYDMFSSASNTSNNHTTMKVPHTLEQPSACVPISLHNGTSPGTATATKPTPKTPYVMPACQWRMILEWCQKVSLPVFFGLNLLSNRAPGSGGGIWQPENAYCSDELAKIIFLFRICSHTE